MVVQSASSHQNLIYLCKISNLRFECLHLLASTNNQSQFQRGWFQKKKSPKRDRLISRNGHFNNREKQAAASVDACFVSLGLRRCLYGNERLFLTSRDTASHLLPGTPLRAPNCFSAKVWPLRRKVYRHIRMCRINKDQTARVDH